MKKALLLIIACSLFITKQGFSQSVLIHYWNFNNYVRNDTFPAFSPVKADYSIIDTNKAQIVYQAQPGYDPTSYDDVTYLGTYTATDTLNESVNSRNGAAIGNAMRVANPSDSLELLFYIPSTGYKNLRLKFISYPSSTTSGQKVQLYDYSTDSGMTWKNTGLSQLSDTFYSKIWRLDNLTFGTDTTVNNNAKLVFRIKFALQTTGSSGNNRFDNVTLDGDSVSTATTDTTSSTAAVPVLSNNNAYTLYPNPAGNNLNIMMPGTGHKTIAIYNIAGQKTATYSSDGNQSTIDISLFTTGMYYVHIINSDGGTYVTKFIKE